MAALATVDDVQARLTRTLSSAERTVLEALLDDASAAVRSYCGQTFDSEETTVRLQARRGCVRLGNGPVTEVASVADVDGNDLAFTWDAGQVVYLGSTGRLNSFEIEPIRTGPFFVDVTYTHGYDDVPGDVVAVVCQMAARALGQPADSSGISQESIGSYSYSIGAAAASGGVGMLPAERAVLDRYRTLTPYLPVS